MRSMLSSLLPSKAKASVSIAIGTVVGLYTVYKWVTARREAELKAVPQVQGALPQIHGDQPAGEREEVQPDAKIERELERKEHEENLEEKGSEDDLEKCLCCPISDELMVDPVMTSNGNTYDRKNIQQWFSEGHKTDPLTNLVLGDLTLKPNFAVKSVVAAYHKKQKPLTLSKQKTISPYAVQTQRSSLPEVASIQNPIATVEAKQASLNFMSEQKRPMNETELKALFELRFAQLSAENTEVKLSNLHLAEQKMGPSHIVQDQKNMLSEAEAARRSTATTEILSKLSNYANANGFLMTVRKHHQLPALELLDELKIILPLLPINTTLQERTTKLQGIMANILRRDQNASGDFDKALRSAWNKIIDCYPEVVELYPKLPEKRGACSMYEDFIVRGGRLENIPGFTGGDSEYAYR